MSGSHAIPLYQRRTVGAASGVLILVLALMFRAPLESSMALHMLVQIPAILAAGYCLARVAPRALSRRFAVFDEYGITGLLALLLLTAYWMIPRALEYPLVLGVAEVAKFVSLLVVGAMLRESWRRANNILRVFFIGNTSSMMAIVGMLYQEAPQRLCNQYLYDDQMVTGTGLVALSVIVPALWLVTQFVTGTAAGRQQMVRRHQSDSSAGSGLQ